MYWELKNGSDLLECEAWIIVDASIIQRIYIHARRLHARYQEMNGNEAALFWLQSFVKAYGPREKSSAAQKTVGSS